ncbi:MAG TPA: zf-TFIIB domain-containing protein [Gammaproteobacteria bacterium]|nr:zf-TFIIB domain-containing protein [Gammaproteobacteria bacterium]
MICPRCNTGLDIRDIDGIPISNCPACNGNWIGGAALAALFARDRNAPRIEEALEAILDLDFRDGRRLCPRCRGKHMQAMMVDGIELDYCVACKGLYFDQGELEQVFPSTFRAVRAAAGADDNALRQFWTVILKFTGGDRKPPGS